MCSLFHFTAKNFWAKDIIFLVTTHREVGMQAWINSYMGTYSTGKKIVLKLHTRYKYILKTLKKKKKNS